MDGVTFKYAVPEDYNLGGTLWLAGMGSRDPCIDLKEGLLSYNTPDGAVACRTTKKSDVLRVTCHGDGIDWIEPRLPNLLGLMDQPQGFTPCRKLEELARRMPGLRLPTLPVLFPRLVQVILQQLVSWNDALAGWRQLVRRYGTDAPGPFSLRLAPTPQAIRELGYYDIVECGVLPRQARLILKVARDASSIERRAGTPESLSEYLLRLPGIGEWTVQHLLGTSCGVADALMPGDYGLPHTVAWFFLGKERSDDAEMFEILERYRGHRFRVINLLWQSGIEAPRRGPKMRSNRWRFSKRANR